MTIAVFMSMKSVRTAIKATLSANPTTEVTVVVINPSKAMIK